MTLRKEKLSQELKEFKVCASNEEGDFFLRHCGGMAEVHPVFKVADKPSGFEIFFGDVISDKVCGWVVKDATGHVFKEFNGLESLLDAMTWVSGEFKVVGQDEEESE